MFRLAFFLLAFPLLLATGCTPTDDLSAKDTRPLYNNDNGA